MDKLLSSISLSKRAGKLLLGFDVVKGAVLEEKAALVLFASDLSDKTRRSMERICEEWNVPAAALPFTLDEIWVEVGKRAGILAISDRGLAKLVCSNLAPAPDKEECLYDGEI